MEKTLKIELEELREQIAQEIESYIDSDSEARAFTLAADIARGKK
jgi:hypothetical protein